ncbi:MAG: 50S ribosomal protein L15 [bacterium]|nr:50S ribosomal protein L15 [bacterium]
MKLHSLVRSKGLKDKLNRRGRGNASGRGNFSGRGCNGQKSRSGHSMKPFFEGGQTSVVQRMPKHRGFKRYYKLVDTIEVVNLAALEKDERITSMVNKELLVDLGYIRSNADAVKVLGNGDFSKALSFEGIELFSNSAKAKIEKAGGSIK